MTAVIHEGQSVEFYGVLREVIQLIYNSSVQSHRTVVLLHCDWYNLDGTTKSTGIDDDRHFRSINIKSFWYKDDPFILMAHAKKIFYLQDTSLGKDWRVVQKFKHRDMYDVNVTEHQVHCWRSLTIKFDRQLISKIGEINKLIAHIHLLLTYFHMYWILSVLRDIYMKYMGSMVKVRKPKSLK